MRKHKQFMKACGSYLLWAMAAVALPAQTQTTAGVAPAQAATVAPTVTFTALHSFDGTDGEFPDVGLVQATDGKLYGTTSGGGINIFQGTIFKITPNGVLTTVHSLYGREGSQPSELIQASDGDFYGTTYAGGYDYGTVFNLSPGDVWTTLYDFCRTGRHCTDGKYPDPGLVQGNDGNFYGTAGGAGGGGTLFKITPGGVLTTVHTFGLPGGSGPIGLVQGIDGNFYGVTGLGGTGCPEAGCGTVYKITPGGVYTTLHSFDGTDGNEPHAVLVQGTDGNFYGTTVLGGKTVKRCVSTYGGCGTIFKITPNGNFTVLYEFSGTDGDEPQVALIQASDGNFYGTTLYGGAEANDQGTVFRITPAGNLTTLHSFCSQTGCPDGGLPEAALVQATNGKLYGTTGYGGDVNCNGSEGCGTIFSLAVGLGPFVETQPTSRNVGAGVKILGNNLTGATSVTFNGTPATFSVPRNTLIRATVPAGAATGPVQVVTPKGTLSSNVPFRVN